MLGKINDKEQLLSVDEYRLQDTHKVTRVR